MNKKFSLKLWFGRNYQFGCVLLVLWLAGCLGIPSKIWVGNDSPLPSEQTPRDAFSLGERPVVYIQGFEGTPEVVLQLFCDGKMLSENKYPLHTGETHA